MTLIETVHLLVPQLMKAALLIDRVAKRQHTSEDDDVR